MASKFQKPNYKSKPKQQSGITLDGKGNDLHPQFFVNQEDYEFGAFDAVVNSPENRIINKTNRFYDPLIEPLQTNFKLLIDWNANHGLFADESYVNSALAYFKRTDDILGKYKLCKQFIQLFKEFITIYDYLIIGCDGLEEAYELNTTWKFPNRESVITIKIRETLNFRWAALMGMYNSLWWDSERGCEILPENLRMFNCMVLVYAGGYYNPLYDGEFKQSGNKNEIIDDALPTKYKLHKAFGFTYDKQTGIQSKFTGDYSNVNFACTIMDLYNCQILQAESGKTLYSELTNINSEAEPVMNQLVFSYQFSNHNVHSKTAGADMEVMGALALATKVNNNPNIPTKKKMSFWKFLKEGLSDSAKTIMGTLSKQVGEIGINTLDTIFGKASPIRSTITGFTDKNTVTGIGSNLITKLADKYVYENLTWLNNVIMRNFNVETFKQIPGYSIGKDKLPEIDTLSYDNNMKLSTDNVSKNIEYQENIFNRDSF